MTPARNRIILEPQPLKLGNGWYVKATHPNGQTEHVTGFKSQAEAKDGISNSSKGWLRMRGYPDE